MSELDGFVVYKPQKETKMHISVGRRGIGITRSAVDALGVPEYINIFLDEVKHRVMIKYAEADYENTLKISNNGRSGLTINCKRIAEHLCGWYGLNTHVPGHEAGDGILIFELPTGKR